MKRLPYYLAAGGATFLFSAFLAATAPAQTAPPAPNPNQGAFEKLSTGNQKIAQSLFDAQQSNTTPTTTQPLSRDDIAAMKQDGKGWGQVFKDMQSQGLVQEKNLGQIVSKSNRDIHQDRRDLGKDRRDVREDRRDLRRDTRELRRDRRDLRTDRGDFSRPDRPERTPRPERPHRR